MFVLCYALVMLSNFYTISYGSDSRGNTPLNAIILDDNNPCKTTTITDRELLGHEPFFSTRYVTSLPRLKSEEKQFKGFYKKTIFSQLIYNTAILTAARKEYIKNEYGIAPYRYISEDKKRVGSGLLEILQKIEDLGSQYQIIQEKTPSGIVEIIEATDNAVLMHMFWVRLLMDQGKNLITSTNIHIQLTNGTTIENDPTLSAFLVRQYFGLKRYRKKQIEQPTHSSSSTTTTVTTTQ